MTENQMTTSRTQPLTAIDGVYLVPFVAYEDERGRFMETFRREWFPWITWDRLQNNRSDSVAGVLRGLHYHFHQIDYWTVVRGRIRVGLADLRPSSPTYGVSTTLELGDHHLAGLFIPSGVAHGFYALTDCTLMYLVNNYYSGADELGVAWDDPDLNVAWNLDRVPMLSGRDQTNPRLGEIPEHLRPV